MMPDDEEPIDIDERRMRGKDWKELLIPTGKQGKPAANLANAEIAFKLAPAWRGVVGFNSFSMRTEILRRPPFEHAVEIGGEWTSHHDTQAAIWCQHRGIGISDTQAAKAINVVSRCNEFHPVRDYLEGLQWDGIGRLDRMLFAHFGADTDNGAPSRLRYLAAVGARWMISAVARIMRPGCQVDTILVLQGGQGARKSSAFRALAGDQWFKDDLGDIASKDAAEGLAGQWIVEGPEMASLHRAEIEVVKSYFVRRFDKFRPAYGHRSESYPRQCVFCATSNEDAIFKDHTGNRRFWPVAVSRIDLDGIIADRDQLWGEARARFAAREHWWIDDAETDDDLTGIVRAEQDNGYEVDVWEDDVSNYIRTESVVSTVQILEQAINKQKKDCGRVDQMRVAAILRHLGWERFKRREGSRTEWRYRRMVEK